MLKSLTVNTLFASAATLSVLVGATLPAKALTFGPKIFTSTDTTFNETRERGTDASFGATNSFIFDIQTGAPQNAFNFRYELDARGDLDVLTLNKDDNSRFLGVANKLRFNLFSFDIANNIKGNLIANYVPNWEITDGEYRVNFLTFPSSSRVVNSATASEALLAELSTGSTPPPQATTAIFGIKSFASFSEPTRNPAVGVDPFPLLSPGSYVLEVTPGDPFFSPNSPFPTDRISLTASVTPGSTPIPTPALLPGLVGMGVAALRKRKRDAAEQAEA